MKNLLRSAATLAVVSIASALTACWPAQTYDNNGLSFNYPAGWKVAIDEFSNQRGYLQLEKEGETPTASVIFGWMVTDASIAADMMLSSIFKQMEVDEPGLANVVTEPPMDVNYGDYPARAMNYTATLDGAAVAGAVWVFTAQGRLMNVAVREGADKDNVGAFKKIKESFQLK